MAADDIDTAHARNPAAWHPRIAPAPTMWPREAPLSSHVMPKLWMTCGIVCGICMLTLCLFGSVSIFLAIGEETFAKPPPEVAESAA